MPAYHKRVIITLLPEWEPELDQLKKNRFYNTSQAEMFRYIIYHGLASLKNEKAPTEKKTGRVS